MFIYSTAVESSLGFPHFSIPGISPTFTTFSACKCRLLAAVVHEICPGNIRYNSSVNMSKVLTKQPFIDGLKNYPENREKDLNKIRNWLSTQPHLPEISDEYVYLFLHACYYSHDRTKHAIDAYFTLRTNTPSLFSNRDSKCDSMITVMNMAFRDIMGIYQNHRESDVEESEIYTSKIKNMAEACAKLRDVQSFLFCNDKSELAAEVVNILVKCEFQVLQTKIQN